MPVEPETFGLNNGISIILGGNLINKNASLFKLAQSMRKEKKVAQLFTMDGLVKVKLVKGPNQRAFTIRNTTEL